MNGEKEMIIANRVREFRQHRLMTQSQLARKAGISLRTLSNVERGKPCQFSTKVKLCRALGHGGDLQSRHLVFPVPVTS